MIGPIKPIRALEIGGRKRVCSSTESHGMDLRLDIEDRGLKIAD